MSPCAPAVRTPAMPLIGSVHSAPDRNDATQDVYFTAVARFDFFPLLSAGCSACSFTGHRLLGCHLAASSAPKARQRFTCKRRQYYPKTFRFPQYSVRLAVSQVRFMIFYLLLVRAFPLGSRVIRGFPTFFMVRRGVHHPWLYACGCDAGPSTCHCPNLHGCGQHSLSTYLATAPLPGARWCACSRGRDAVIYVPGIYTL